MADVVFAGTASLLGTSVSIPDDPSMQAGDLRRASLSISNNDISTYTGWDLVSNTVVASTRRIVVLERTHQGASEPADLPVTLTSSSNYGLIQVGIRDADNANPNDPVPAFGGSTSNVNSLVAPSVTSTKADGLFIVTAHQFVVASSTTMSTPSGMTEVITGTGTGSAGHSVGCWKEQRPTAGATGTRTTTSSQFGNYGTSSQMIANKVATSLPPRSRTRPANRKR